MEDKLKKQADDLSDIVLEKESGSSVDRTKKILLYAASLILLFLVALVAMKLMNESSSESGGNLAQIGNEIEQSATGDESVDRISQKLEDTNKLFQQEPIIDESVETDLKFEEMVRKLKAQDAATQEEHETKTAVAAVQNAGRKTTENAVKQVQQKAAEAKDTFHAKVDEIAESIRKSKNPDAIKPEAVQKRTEVLKPRVVSPKIVHKPEVRKPVQRSVKREEIQHTRIVQSGQERKLSSLSGYFIQVGATANTFPDRRYLQKIKDVGYDYIVHSMVINGRKIKKILVGPYSSRSAAKAELPDVQAKINPGAYIYRIR